MNNPGAWILGEVYRYIYSQLGVATDFKKILMGFSDGRVGMLSGRNRFARALPLIMEKLDSMTRRCRDRRPLRLSEWR